MHNSEIILGVQISKLNLAQTRATVSSFLHSSNQRVIFTPNPEFLVRAHKDIYFKNILNSADLNVCDGVGIKLASAGKLVRIPGVDLMKEICQMSAQNNLGIFLLGGVGDVAKITAESLSKQIPSLQVVGYDSGPVIHDNTSASSLIIDKTANEDLTNKINQSGASVLFVAFGMGKQEKWIKENISKMPNIRLAMGVGGSFDYISGVVRRAPCFMRKFGLEWLYRLLRQPQRFGRILNATLVFTYLVIKDKLK